MLPFIDYGDILYIYMCMHIQILEKLQKLQHQAIRICLNLQYRTPRVELMWQSKLPKLEYRRLAHLGNYMYKRKEDPSYLDNRMVVTRRGDAVSVKVNRANLAVFKKVLY